MQSAWHDESCRRDIPKIDSNDSNSACCIHWHFKKAMFEVLMLAHHSVPHSFVLFPCNYTAGSNVMGIETTATYDPATQEFVISTPNNEVHHIISGSGVDCAFAPVVVTLHQVSSSLLSSLFFPSILIFHPTRHAGIQGVDRRSGPARQGGCVKIVDC